MIINNNNNNNNNKKRCKNNKSPSFVWGLNVVKTVMISAYNTMFGSSLPPVVCRRAHVLFTLFVFAVVYWCPAHIVLYFCFVFLRIIIIIIIIRNDAKTISLQALFGDLIRRLNSPTPIHRVKHM
jgi:hypothetical protein